MKVAGCGYQWGKIVRRQDIDAKFDLNVFEIFGWRRTATCEEHTTQMEKSSRVGLRCFGWEWAALCEIMRHWQKNPPESSEELSIIKGCALHIKKIRGFSLRRKKPPEFYRASLEQNGLVLQRWGVHIEQKPQSCARQNIQVHDGRKVAGVKTATFQTAATDAQEQAQNQKRKNTSDWWKVDCKTFNKNCR